MNEGARSVPIEGRLVRLALGLGAGVAVLGLAVLGGWIGDVAWLKAPVSGTRVMVPNTALMLILGGVGLAGLAPPRAAASWRALGRIAALAVAAIAAFTLVEYLAGVDLGLDRFLMDAEPARPAPNTATAFLFLAVALLRLDRWPRRGPAAAELLAAIVAGHAVLILTGYLYGYTVLAAPPSLPENIGMAVHTAVATLLLGAGIILSRPHRGWTAIITSDHVGGVAARRVLLALMIVIPLTDAVSLLLERAGLYPAVGTAVVHSVVMGAALLAAVLVIGSMLNRTSRERERVEEALRQWKTFFDAARFGAVITGPDGVIEQANEAFARMHGVERAALAGRSVAELISEDERVHLDAWLHHVATRGALRFETTGRRADGTTFPVAIDATALETEGGHVKRTMAYVQDITDERRAREARGKLAALVDSAEDAIIAMTPDGVITEWNPGAERLYGVSASEVVGQTTDAIVPDDRRDERDRMLAGFQAGEQIAGVETERLHRDGRRIPVSVTWSRILGVRGETLGICAVERDVTDLAAVARASAAISDATTGIAATGLDHVLEVIAEQAKLLTGAQFAEIRIAEDSAGRTRSARGSLPPPLQAAAPTLLVPVQSRGVVTGAVLLTGKDGGAGFTERDRRVVDLLMAHLAGAIEVSLLYERESLQRAWLESIVSQMPEAVLVIDAAGRVVVENEVARGFRDDVPAGDPTRPRWDVRSPAGIALPSADLPLERALRFGETTHGRELAVRVPSGEVIPILASATPVRQGDRIAGAVAVFHDIRALKELERLRTEWTSLIAHDLRQPANAMRLAAELLLRGDLADKARSWAQRISGEALRMATMVEDLLDASRLDAHQLSVALMPVPVAALVRDACERAPDLAARCLVRIAPEADHVLADPGRIGQVLGNLLSNAVKYGDPGTPIAVTAERAGAMVCVAVSNHGPDLTDEERAALFRRFARTDRARRAGIEGTGLGLYLARGLVEAHGGEISVSSGGGRTTFQFTLRIADDVPARTMQPTETWAS